MPPTEHIRSRSGHTGSPGGDRAVVASSYESRGLPGGDPGARVAGMVQVRDEQAEGTPRLILTPAGWAVMAS
ncbi:hypothetical protein GCM10009716_29970 [Streptomyces sodiiphilus]|uniref:DUF397 domain-containing protein n=1 Tax=Streptomyces sodiiphilus TaxID=226217 RepID=A0ABN2PFA9_9ACTN